MILEAADRKTKIARFTTPTLRFTMSKYSVENIVNASLNIIYKGERKVHKVFSEMESSTATNKVWWTLTQADTGALPEGKVVSIYCKWLLADGTAGRSKYSEAMVVPSGEEEVMTSAV